MAGSAAAAAPLLLHPAQSMAQNIGRSPADGMKMVRVNPGSFMSALQGAAPGTVIILGDGTYSTGKVALGGQDVTLWAENPLKARLDADIEISGANNVIGGLDLARSGGGGEYGIVMRGEGHRIFGCNLFRTAGRLILLEAEGCRIDYCNMSVLGKEATPSGGGHGAISDPTGKGRNNIISRNLFYRFPLKASDYHAVQVSCIGVGDNPVDFDIESGLIIVQNMFYETGAAEISIKTSRNRILGNTIIGSDKTICHGNQRSGNYNEWACNWFEKTKNSASIVVHGGHHRIINNYCEGDILIRNGKTQWNQTPSGEPRIHHAAHCIVSGNRGKVILGHEWGGEGLPLPAEGTLIAAGQDYQDSGARGTQRISDVGGYPPPMRLSTQQIGLTPFLESVGKVSGG